MKVELRDHSGTGVPPPYPIVLAAHAVLAKVFYASGGKYIDKVWWDEEPLTVLAEDGSNAKNLDVLLLSSSKVVTPNP